MSGIYNNWYKVNNPSSSNNIPQMESGGYQKPFFFGASQIPEALDLTNTSQNISGKGLKRKMDFKPQNTGKKVQYIKPNNNIILPRNLI